MGPVDRIWEFLQRLSPLTRSCLLSELERLELSGVEMPGTADLQARLRAEIRKDGVAGHRTANPSRFCRSSSFWSTARRSTTMRAASPAVR